MIEALDYFFFYIYKIAYTRFRRTSSCLKSVAKQLERSSTIVIILPIGQAVKAVG